MRSGAIVAIVALLGVGSVVGIACSSTDAENPSTTCDPATDPSCTSSETGGETSTGDADVDSTVTGDTGSTADAPVGDGFTVLPDGAMALPDGAILLPDGAIITDAGAIPCVAGATECTNCKDDDGDGKTDWLDPECTGPLDNDESSFATGIPGDNVDCKQDCFFDGNSGGGDDGCVWSTQCLVGYKPPPDSKCKPYDAAAAMDPKICPKPTDKCIKNCKPYVPKGCDCAGCCQVFDAAGMSYTVRLVDTCSTATLSDPTKCPRCDLIADCSNPCGKCDWCLGKTMLPPECYPAPDAGPDAPPPPDGTPPPDAPPPDATPPSTCEGGLTACSPTMPCPIGYYCLTGCCIKPPS
jgi:hypothetical protein